MGRECSTNGEKTMCRILVGKPEGKRGQGRSRRRSVNHIKTNLRERRRDCAYWVDLAEDRDRRRALVNTVMNLRIP
jgi:RNase H-fold protein (predicted Holliday junction resolvase)